MAENNWINGYLEAILDTDGRVQDLKQADKKQDDNASNQAANFFVNEITSLPDEASLHRTWMKATAMKNVHERGSRLEYLCWRIWHMTRQKKKIEWEEAQRLAAQHMERETDRAADGFLSEEIEQEEETSEPATPAPGASDQAPQHRGGDPFSQEQKADRKLYIVLISLHGLVRGEHMELGKDADTGGQVKYVVEFARALAAQPQVYRVDLLTRQICDPEVDWSYGEPTEMISPPPSEDEEGLGESAGAYIVRIPAGPRDKYIRKEELWPYVQEFADGALAHILHMVGVLGEQVGGGEPVWPYVIHGHYADAGDIASLLSGALNVPMVLTGHSLGRNKLEQLIKQGRQTRNDIESTYKIGRRIEAEEFSLDSAELVVTSTHQEIEQQWGLYDGFDMKLERVLRARRRRNVSCHGRHMPRMAVIPPGMDFSNVIAPPEDSAEGNTHGSEESDPPIWTQVNRFLSNPHKPIVLALARADPKKNLATLVKAYGENKHLRDLANLVLIMGNRDDIDAMNSNNANVLTQVLKLIDKYDLYGQVAYPKHHKQPEVPDLYRLAAITKGVFCNPALVEPFGLTLIEACAHGLPMVATKNGGPVDIEKTLSNGLLIDPHDSNGIAEALLKLMADRNLWIECRRSGLQNIHKYAWPSHCRQYLTKIAACRQRHPAWKRAAGDMLEGLSDRGDSLRDIGDMSINMSIDEDFSSSVNRKFNGKALGGGSLTSPADLQRLIEASRNSGDGKKEGGLQRYSSGQGLTRRSSGMGTALQTMREEEENHSFQAEDHFDGSTDLGEVLKLRKQLVVVALDAYDDKGQPADAAVKVLKAVIEARQSGGLSGLGVALATALAAPEIVSLLDSINLSVRELDLVIAGSGSDLYYSGPAQEGEKSPLADKNGGRLYPDSDYETHIGYRWGGEGIRRAMLRILQTPDPLNGEEKASSKGLVEDSKGHALHRVTFKVTDLSQAPTGAELRRRLRTRGLRSNVVYCRRNRYLHLLPVHASRSQALRYIFVRWGLDVSKMVVVTGYHGDADMPGMLVGTHRVVLVGGAVEAEEASKGKAAGSSNFNPAELANVTAVDEKKGPGGAIEGLKEVKIL